jgi:hypothetical protein
MNVAPGAATATPGWRVEPLFLEPLDRFFFATEGWVQAAALDRLVGAGGTASAGPATAGDAAGLRRAVARALPPRRLSPEMLTRDLRGRLALLPRADWLRLGLCLSALPFCGHILRSMDGHFRRAVRQALDEPALESLDRQDVAVGRVEFLLGPGAWRTPERVALGGMRAALEQACLWPDPVRERFLLQFGPDELALPPSVVGLNLHWLEIACKASLADHPWLWS